ncbi:MAG: S8 family serine peptidase [Candidatus Eisenbacteria bacterium]
MHKVTVIGVLLGVSLTFWSVFAMADTPVERITDHTLMLKSRQFIPDEGVSRELMMSPEGDIKWHMIVQFRDIPDPAQVSALEAQGIRLVGYLPNNAYFAGVPQGKLDYLAGLPDFRSALAVGPDDKISPHIRAHGVAGHARNDDGTVRITAVFFGDVDAARAHGIAGRFGNVTEVITRDNTFTINMFEAGIRELAHEDEVQWIEQAPPEKREALDDCRATNGVEIVQAPPYSLDGTGVTLGMWDSGSIATTHQDFTGRLTIPDGSATSNHGTGVGGCMAGDGTQSQPEGGTPYQWRGMAPGADIVSYDWPSTISNLQTETSEAINTYGAITSNNSWIWGLCSDYCSYYGEYDDWSQEYDRLVRGSEGAPITVVLPPVTTRTAQVARTPWSISRMARLQARVGRPRTQSW